MPKTETPEEMEARLRAAITAELAPKTEPVVAATETPAAMEARIRKEVTDINTEVTALCTMAGKPNKAAEFIAQGKTVAEVRAALTADAGTAAPAATVAVQQQLNTHVDVQPQLDNKGLVATVNEADVWKNYNNHGKGTPLKLVA